MTGRKIQRDRLIELLIKARGWVPLPEILALGIAQYSARIHELRALGFRIENRRERVDGTLHTYFRLTGGVAVTPPKQEQPSEPGPTLFGNLAPDRSYCE